MEKKKKKETETPSRWQCSCCRKGSKIKLHSDKRHEKQSSSIQASSPSSFSSLKIKSSIHLEDFPGGSGFFSGTRNRKTESVRLLCVIIEEELQSGL